MKRSRPLFLLIVLVVVISLLIGFLIAIRQATPEPLVTITYGLDTRVAQVVATTMQVINMTLPVATTPLPTITTFPTRTATPPPTGTPSETVSPTPSSTPTSPDPLEPLISPTVTLPALYEAVCVPNYGQREVGQVIDVFDGDTILVRLAAGDLTVGYIGIEAPDAGARYAKEAKSINTNLVLWEWVTLVKDISETDREGRLLRYVFLEDTFVNYDLVRQGHVRVAEDPLNTACADTFQDAEAEARKFQLGLWKPGPTKTWTPIPSNTLFPSSTSYRTPTITPTGTLVTPSQSTTPTPTSDDDDS